MRSCVVWCADLSCSVKNVRSVCWNAVSCSRVDDCGEGLRPLSRSGMNVLFFLSSREVRMAILDSMCGGVEEEGERGLACCERRSNC